MLRLRLRFANHTDGGGRGPVGIKGPRVLKDNGLHLDDLWKCGGYRAREF